MKKNLYLIVVSILISATSGCGAGSVRVAILKDKPTKKFAIGFIEDRFVDYAPYISDNFADMLSYEIIARGYGLSIVPKSAMVQEEADKKNNAADESKKKTDDFDSLLPAYSRDMYNSGGKDMRSRSLRLNKMMRSEDIKKISQEYDFDFFIQGSVCEENIGEILDEEKNCLIFLEVFDKAGTCLGAINLYVEGRSLQESKYLQSRCQDIAEICDQKILKK